MGKQYLGLTPRGLKCREGTFEPKLYTFSNLAKWTRATLFIYVFLVFIQKVKTVKKERCWDNGRLKVHFKLHTWAEKTKSLLKKDDSLQKGWCTSGRTSGRNFETQ